MNLRNSLLTAFCGGLIALAAANAQAVLYKWTDENGRVVYGDQPPASAKPERVNTTGVGPGDPGAVRSMAAKDAEIKKRQQQRADNEAKADKEQADAKKKVDMCAQARGRIRTLRDDVNVYRYNEKGEKIFFEPAERQKAIADNEKLMRDLNCPAAPSS
jgi:hypothetical protein